MHPEIKKFLETDTLKIITRPLGDTKVWYLNDTTKHNSLKAGILGIIVCMEIPEILKRYFYNNNNYSEEEMLRVIKLKAFL